MYDFHKIVGHKHIVEKLQNAIKNDAVSHAYIIHGENGAGKKHLAYAFAKTLECEKQGIVSCNQCESCIQIESGNQPDLIEITKDKVKSISVDEIRHRLNGTVQIKPYYSRYKIYIIDEAENLTLEAQNAILKTIEEPPEYAIFMFLVSNMGALLSTIISRCVRIDVRPIEDELIRDYVVNELNIPEYKVNLCVAFAQGNIGRAKKLAQSESFIQIKEQTIHLLKYLNEMQIYEIVESIKHLTTNKLQIHDCLNLMITWYRDLLMLKTTNNLSMLVYKEEYAALKHQSELISYNSIDHIIMAIDKAIVRVDANVNYEVVLELMLLTMKENING